ncbi:hypothetical protein [Leifsonia sp. Leaf264]|uniref:hypothetical protein n=1 Tax=Leifsonia sp. Leaf264 TaxID=1736314 RepID=UPI0006FD5465|nr:hypothetical protein [Leifsonia sp. Leaf264]KQO98465.1 hypothetical protein ASF30_10410 [Leifsonia sp. Leaf264]
MNTIIHAYAAYGVDPSTKEFDSTVTWEFFVERADVDAEESARVGYAQTANLEDTAATQYRVTFTSDEQILKTARRSSTFTEDGADRREIIAEAMDVIEWDLNWNHPAVSIVRENTAAQKLRQSTVTVLNTNPIVTAFRELGEDATADVAADWTDSLTRYMAGEPWEHHDYEVDLCDVIDDHGITPDSDQVTHARAYLHQIATTEEAA